MMAAPLQETAYRYLVEQIRSGGLQPGKVYSETQMCRELNISRTPFKEALMRLSQDKYVDILPSRGFQIHKITEQDIRETVEMRTALEGFCAIRLVERLTLPSGKMVLRQLARLMDQMYRWEQENNMEEFLKADIEFHETLVRYSENREFSRIFDSSMHQIAYLASQSLQSNHRMEDTLSEHQKIVDAIVDQKPMEVLRAVTEHMNSALVINLERLKDGRM